MRYQFTPAKEKARKSGYDSLTVPEKWEYHADVYGWRRARLGASPDERVSPCDPNGEWFDAYRADIAEKHYRGERQRTQDAVHAARLERNRPPDPADAVPVMDQWARDHGYLDLADYQEREWRDYVDARCNIARSFLAAALARDKQAFGEPAEADRAAMLAELGVIATERKPRTYTAEEMRQARIALGLEEPDPPVMAAQ